MRKIGLVFLVNENFDCLPIFERAFREIGFDTDVTGIPNVWISGLNRKLVNRLKALLKEKSKGQFSIYSPQSTELFLKEADFTITCSAYRTWFNPKKMRVIPHLWTPVGAPISFDHLRWTSKPPLRIGFMGRFHTTSRLARLILKSPKQLKRWLLRGHFLRYPGIISVMNGFGFSVASINTFARYETMQFLKGNRDKYADVELDIVEKQGFNGSERELDEYISHLERATYVICPRGTENYSFRIYEALSRGRIPVIIDTDVVLPKEINWDYLSVRVPYESLDKIYDIILNDYKSLSGTEFAARQNEAFSSMAQLQTMRWVQDLANEIGSVVG